MRCLHTYQRGGETRGFGKVKTLRHRSIANNRQYTVSAFPEILGKFYSNETFERLWSFRSIRLAERLRLEQRVGSCLSSQIL
jgi:hypothetical protein